jgi:hypothetical protein
MEVSKTYKERKVILCIYINSEQDNAESRERKQVGSTVTTHLHKCPEMNLAHLTAMYLLFYLFSAHSGANVQEQMSYLC